MQLRIFTAPPPTIRPPRPSADLPPPVTVQPRARPIQAATTAASARDEIGDAALAVLASAGPYGESVATSYARKERELGMLFTSLSAEAAIALHARLTKCAEGDALALQFARMVAERRTRLLAVLADSPRRAAVQPLL